MPTTYLFLKDSASFPVHGDLLVIHNPGLGTIRVFDDLEDTVDDIIGVCTDKSNTLLTNQFSGLHQYTDNTWTYTNDLLLALDENKEQILNPNVTSKNIYSDTDIIFVASVGSYAAIKKTNTAHIPPSWKLIRTNPVEDLCDIYFIM